MTDEAWQSLAEETRDALDLLGYGIEPLCLPGESNPCGGSFEEHALAHLVLIMAVARHHLDHMRHNERWVREVYAQNLLDLHLSCSEGVTHDTQHPA